MTNLFNISPEGRFAAHLKQFDKDFLDPHFLLARIVLFLFPVPLFLILQVVKIALGAFLEARSFCDQVLGHFKEPNYSMNFNTYDEQQRYNLLWFQSVGILTFDFGLKMCNGDYYHYGKEEYLPGKKKEQTASHQQNSTKKELTSKLTKLKNTWEKILIMYSTFNFFEFLIYFFNSFF